MGKRAPSPWNRHVKATFVKMRALDGGAKFKDALKEAAKTWKSQSGGSGSGPPGPPLAAPGNVEPNMNGEVDDAAQVGGKRRRRRTLKKSRKAGGKKSRKSKKTKKRSRKSKKH
tara:strand:+ start:148 stop:489 length:342 start_codon:yes stop_codon:yes gene_type:complete